MYCKNCGNLLNDTQKYCTQCGEAISNDKKFDKGKKEQSIAALVLGITSLVFWIIPFLGLPIGVTGLILGIIGVRENKDFAKAALVCSAIGTALSIVELLP